MKTTTLCFLIRGDEVLLAMKKRGFGVGRWNGVGGKVMAGESVEASAVREIQEEIGVVVSIKDLKQAGELEFYHDDNAEWNMRCHVFAIYNWTGDPAESEEIRPQWYRHDLLPFKDMWPDDPHWLPRLLRGEKYKGEFYFTDEGKRITHFNISQLQTSVR